MDINRFRYIDVSSFWKYFQYRIAGFYLIKIENIAYVLFYAAMILAYFSSMYVWIFWPIKDVYPILVAGMLALSMLFSNSLHMPIYGRRDFLLPVLSCAVLLFYQNLATGISLAGIILNFFRLFIFFALFRVNTDCFQHFATLLCKIMACILTLSLMAFILYLMDVPLPSCNAEFNDWYYYTNYYFFLLLDGALNQIIPRFHSIFLEPGHLGTAVVLLLSTQLGKWKKWYNVVLLVALFVSFSLAAYGLLTIIIFLHLWIKRKKILLRVAASLLLIAAVIGGSFLYNGGDNMLNTLIFMRLEVNDTGDDFKGNNRVSSTFETEYESYMQSSDIFFGRKVDNSIMGGNAGYRVYIYTYGIVGLVLCYLFYIIAMHRAPDKRAFISMLILSLVNFWIRAYPLWFGFFVPYYLFAYLPSQHHLTTDAK